MSTKSKKNSISTFWGSKVKVKEAWLIINFIKWSHSIYDVKAHSSSFNVVRFVFQNNEKWQSYEGLNGHRYSKNSKKVESHFWEAIQAMKVKFLRVTYIHLGFSHTEFRPILRGSCAKLWWTDMELPSCKLWALNSIDYRFLLLGMLSYAMLG